MKKKLHKDLHSKRDLKKTLKKNNYQQLATKNKNNKKFFNLFSFLLVSFITVSFVFSHDSEDPIDKINFEDDVTIVKPNSTTTTTVLSADNQITTNVDQYLKFSFL